MTKSSLDPSDFLQNRMLLEDPDAAAVRDAYRSLPRRGVAEIACRWPNRLDALDSLEEAGFFGMVVQPSPDFARVRVTAFKGKTGPCYETGRSATYTGAAAAALDDDHHLIRGALRVCEKTGGLYTLPPYRAFLRVGDADPAKLARLDADPIPFDCDTFDRDARQLAQDLPAVPGQAGLPAARSAAAAVAPVLYPGPFRLLVLADGSILRRGVASLVGRELADALEKRDALIRLFPVQAVEAVVPDHFPDLFGHAGAACLLTGLGGTAGSGHAAAGRITGGAAFSPEALLSCGEGMRERLLAMIRRGDPYFILTGSDPRDRLGCCPSEHVGEANRLVDGGILSCYQPPAPPDACTSSLYAFSGEITAENNNPRFTPNPALRRKVLSLLTSGPL